MWARDTHPASAPRFVQLDPQRWHGGRSPLHWTGRTGRDAAANPPVSVPGIRPRSSQPSRQQRRVPPGFSPQPAEGGTRDAGAPVVGSAVDPLARVTTPSRAHAPSPTRFHSTRRGPPHPGAWGVVLPASVLGGPSSCRESWGASRQRSGTPSWQPVSPLRAGRPVSRPCSPCSRPGPLGCGCRFAWKETGGSLPASPLWSRNPEQEEPARVEPTRSRRVSGESDSSALAPGNSEGDGQRAGATPPTAPPPRGPKAAGTQATGEACAREGACGCRGPLLPSREKGASLSLFFQNVLIFTHLPVSG